jgi:hypothetical protein
MPELKFDEKTHSYYLDGLKLPSVTSVLRDARLFEYASGNEMYMDRGTNIHMLTELHDTGALDESKVENSILSYLYAWKRFKEDTGIEVLAIEEPVYHPIYLYAGKVDRRVRWNGNEAVIDIKSGLYAPWHALQTAAYAKTYGRTMLRFCVYLSDDGSYDLKEHLDPTDWDIFRSALAIANWKRKNNLLRGV